MTREDFLYLTPLMIVAASPVMIMLIIAMKRNFQTSSAVSLAGFVLAFLSIFLVPMHLSHAILPLFIFDGFARLFSGIIILASLLVTVLSHRYLLLQESEREEYFIILFTAALGAMILVAACNFVTLFLGIETLSISLYILIAYRRARRNSIEAAVKYLILASVSSAFLLFGMGLIYLDTGTLEFAGIARVLNSQGHSTSLLLGGFSMMMVGIGFKLALVPFHMWTPDIYQGAPVPVAAFIATVSKGAVLAVLLRFFYAISGYANPGLALIITTLAILTMFTGNLLAIREQNIKRILAFSSIANMGYLLLPMMTASSKGLSAAVFYIVSYMVTTLGAFGIITLLSGRNHDADNLSDYEGLFRKRPWLAISLTLVMLSLAGIPVSAGFIAKFYLVLAGVDSGLWLLVFSLILNSVISLYYYLRVITTLFTAPNDVKFPSVSLAGSLVIIFISIVILWLGINPEAPLRFISGLAGFSMLN